VLPLSGCGRISACIKMGYQGREMPKLFWHLPTPHKSTGKSEKGQRMGVEKVYTDFTARLLETRKFGPWWSWLTPHHLHCANDCPGLPGPASIVSVQNPWRSRPLRPSDDRAAAKIRRYLACL